MYLDGKRIAQLVEHVFACKVSNLDNLYGVCSSEEER